MGQRPPVEPPPEPTLLALQHPQRLHHHLFLAGLQPQRSAEPMRVKLELPRSLDPRPTTRPRPPFGLHLRPQLLAPSPQLSVDTPMPESQMGEQEQELRRLLNKDKSKRSKDGSLPTAARPRPAVWAGRDDAGPGRAALRLPGTAGECGSG